MVDRLSALWQWVWEYLVPHGASRQQSIPGFVLDSAEYVLKSYFWFILVSLFIYFFFLRKGPRTLGGAFNHILPKKIYTHPSFKVDLSIVPLAWFLSFTVYASLTLGAGAMQLWLSSTFGPTSYSLGTGALAITLQVVFALLGADFARFLWHYQAHKVAFFWEFHKGHHSPEVLHPVLIRTHPVDMIIRLAYMQVGGGLIGGSLMYVTGVQATAAAASAMAVVGALLHILQMFEHSHIPISFGKTLDRIFYPPHFHPFHHSALIQHRDKNLGITGGLTLWDKVFGTLYIPSPGEMDEIEFGATLEERGAHNPHRSFMRFLVSPFVEAFRTLRPRQKDAALGTATLEQLAD
ncbi:MAG: sterol desaturase family protein [Gammaproteobacteria bacterium]|nr:sterol desaturase family protein [Gammaproteobacteria bacterium]